MSETTKQEIHFTIARASAEQVQTMRDWFQELEELLDDEKKDVLDIGKFIQDTFERRRIDEYERILSGFETLVDNACDKNISYIDWKPEIKKALEAAKLPT